MPRAEDIAWKFVIRQGKKWRCPYCKIEYSGSVTRVRSHFLKKRKEGIASCTKVPEHIRTLMELLLNHELLNKEDVAWKFVNRLGENKWRCHHCSEEFFGDLTGVRGHLLKVPNEGISICREVPDHVRKLMLSLLDELAEEESREANGQSSAEPQSGRMPTHVQVAEEESREANSQFFTGPQSCERPIQAEVAEEESRDANNFTELLGPLLSPEFLPAELFSPIAFEQMVLQLKTATGIGVDSDQQSQPERQFHLSSTMPLLVQSNHVQPVLVPPQHQNAPHQSETRNVLQNPTAQSSTALRDMDLHILPSSQASNAAPQWPTDVSNFNQQDINGLNSGQQPQAECRFPQSSTMPSLAQNSHGESTSCSTGALVEELMCLVDSPHQPQCSFRSPYREEMPMNDQQTLTGASRFQDDQLPSVSNSNCLQDCNRHSQFQSPMDIDPSVAPRHTSDSHIIEATMDDSQVAEGATNTTGPSSSHDMNGVSLIMEVRSIYANDEEIRNLKRKVEEEVAASLVQKKPRISFQEGLKNTERARYKLIGRTLPQKLPREARDAKGDALVERKLIGEAIQTNIELIWNRLKQNHPCKFGICGMGGVGKTTIMRHIHNRLLEDATFDGVVFITMSQDFNNYKLQSAILKALKLGDMEDEPEQERAAKLYKHLERKKNFVLILDNVWNHFDLEEVGIPVRADGIKLVLTTRSIDVCHQLCQEKIEIKPLSQEEAMNLFLEELGSEVVPDLKIKALMKSIVGECAGLPIGLITMARSMRGKTEVFEWSDSLVELQESSKGQKTMEQKVLMNLKFSYDNLDNPDVQRRFLSCALYPEGEFIDKCELVEFFIDQGLIGGLNTRKEQYDRGLTTLKKLRNAFLLEDHGSTMKMHDLIRDMALNIMSATSIVQAGKQLMRIPSEELWTGALEKISLMKNDIQAFPLNTSPNCPKLSTLLLNGCLSRNVVVPDSFFKNLLGLKVLNLSGCHLTKLPNSISDLVNLRALLLKSCKELCCIPYLGKLTSLRKLDVSGCCMLEAPEGLGRLVNLEYLDLGSTGTRRLPKGTLGGLLNLQYLKFGAVDGEDITKLKALETLKWSWEVVGDFNKCVRDDFNGCVRAIDQINRFFYDLYVDERLSIWDVEVKNDAPFRNGERTVTIFGVSHAIVSMGGECTANCSGDFILTPRDVQTMIATDATVLQICLAWVRLSTLRS